jgi:hypothetical protein
MKAFIGLILLALTGVVTSSTAFAQNTQKMGTFSFPGADFNVPLPAGYCIPQGVYETKAKMVAATDTGNLTDLSFYSCADMDAGGRPTTWGMVKTPFAFMSVTNATRKELIDALSAKLDPDILQKMHDEIIKRGNTGIHNVVGDISISGLEMKPLSKDVNGVYFGGTVQYSASDHGQIQLTAVYSATVVKGRIFFLYLYGPYQSPGDVLSLLASLQAETAAFLSANGESTLL